MLISTCTHILSLSCSTTEHMSGSFWIFSTAPKTECYLQYFIYYISQYSAAATATSYCIYHQMFKTCYKYLILLHILRNLAQVTLKNACAYIITEHIIYKSSVLNAARVKIKYTLFAAHGIHVLEYLYICVLVHHMPYYWTILYVVHLLLHLLYAV